MAQMRVDGLGPFLTGFALSDTWDSLVQQILLFLGFGGGNPFLFDLCAGFDRVVVFGLPFFRMAVFLGKTA
jgi:hypothetical protein